MKRIHRLSQRSSRLILIMCAVAVLSAVGIINDTSQIPSAYAQNCNGPTQSECLAMGKIWNSSTKTCSDPPACIPSSCPSGYAFDPSICSCRQMYSPCSNIVRMVPVAVYESCSAGTCINCAEAYTCCFYDTVYDTYGAFGEYCGRYSDNSQYSCGYVSMAYTPYCRDLCNVNVTITYPACYP